MMEISLRGLGDGTVQATAPNPVPTVNVAPCPPGYGVPTYSDGLTQAFKGGIGWALVMGPLELFTPSNPGNIVGPLGGENVCSQADRTPFVYRLGIATPGLVVLAVLGMMLFGGKR
jgi:hypothetical protein